MSHTGVPDFVQGPFFNWHEGMLSPSVEKAQAFIYEIIEDEGPFDGVLGLSQGAALAMSMLLHHEIRHPNKPPPFRFAVLICCVVAVSPDQSFNSEYIAKYSKFYNKNERGELANKGKLKGTKKHSSDKEMEETETTGDDLAQPSNDKKSSSDKSIAAPRHRSMLILRSQREALVNELVDLVEDVTAMDPNPEKYGEKWKGAKAEDFPRIFHPLTVKERIHIPTVHVQGKQDPLIRHGALAAKLCDKKRSKVITFDGGHSGPSTFLDHRAVATAIEWAIQQTLYN